MRENTKHSFLLALKGGVIGIANIIPGISGGTMAVALGLYEEIISTIIRLTEKQNENRVRDLWYLSTIGLGSLISILLLSRVLEYLLLSYFQLTMIFFMGLILGSLPTIIDFKHKSFSLSDITFLALGVLPVLFLSENGNAEARVVVIDTLNNHVFLVKIFFAGIVAGGAMIIPGISGSLILLVIGLYYPLIYAIKNMLLLPLGSCGVGVAIGIILFSKIIHYLLKHYENKTKLAILGLIGGSFIKLYHGTPSDIIGLISAAALFIIGSLLAHILAKK